MGLKMGLKMGLRMGLRMGLSVKFRTELARSGKIGLTMIV